MALKILSIETTGPYASVAYLEPETETADERVAPGEFSHLESTLPLAKELLEANGAKLSDVLSATVYMRDPADCAIIREEFAGAFAAEPVFLVAPVCRPGWLVECECIAVVDKTPR